MATVPVPVPQFSLWSAGIIEYVPITSVFYNIREVQDLELFTEDICLQFIVEKKVAEKRMAGYRTRDPMITGQRSHRYTDMSYTPKLEN